MDKAQKRERLKQWRDQERDSARKAIPLPDGEMVALFDMLDRRLSEAGCDHTLRLTDAWLADRGHPIEAVHAWLGSNGGFCDCEALANAEEAWREATRQGWANGSANRGAAEQGDEADEAW